MKTAVEWFEKELQKNFNIEGVQPLYDDLFNQAKELEKQQQKGYSEEDVKNAFLDGWQLKDGDLPFPKAKKKWFNEFKNK